RGFVGLGAAFSADAYPEVVAGKRPWRERMIDPLVAAGVDIELGSEGSHAELQLGPLVDHGALLARERYGFGIGLEQVLAKLRAHRLDQETDMADDRIVAQHRPAGL